jgi:hypothetical protein
MIENIMTPAPFIRPFPAFEDVFGEPASLHRKHFLPLVSVDISLAHPDLTGWLPIVMPVEPLLEGNVGDWTSEYFDFYNKVGQIAFHVSEGRYTFSGDFRFFAYESGAIFRIFSGRDDEIHADYSRRISSYERNRVGFLQHGRIPWSEYSVLDPGTDEECGPLVSQLGGEPTRGNLGAPWPPSNRQGKPLRFIAEVQGFSYCDGGTQAVLLFYDPEEQIALFRFDWT